MNDAIERLLLILNDEYEVAGFRGSVLSAQRISECLTLLRSVLRPIRELQDEAKLLDIALDAGVFVHKEDAEMVESFESLRKVVATIGGPPR